MSEENVEKLPAGIGSEHDGILVHARKLPAFLAKVRQEMKVVHYPTWPEVRSTTVAVIIFVILFAFYLRVLDWIFSPLDAWIFSR